MASDLVDTHMDKLCCDTCGDIGIETALFTCQKCKVGCEHVYCMSKFCMTAPMDPPADWCCEMCRSTSTASSDCGLKEVSSKAVTCKISTTLPHDVKVLTDRQSFCRGARGNWHEKAVGKGKTKYLWTNEVLNMPSGEKKGEPTRVGPISSKPSKSVASGHNMGLMEPKSFHADSSYRVKSNPKFALSTNSKELHPARSGNNTSVQKFKELKSILTPVKEHRQMRQTSSVKDIETSHAKKQKEMGETASASQMSRRSQTCDVPQTDGSLFPAISLASTEVTKKTSDCLQKKISKEPCTNCQSLISVKEFYTKAVAEEPLPTDPATIASWIAEQV